TTYGLLWESKDLPVATVDNYEEYIRYIENRDKREEQRFWKNYLGNIESTTLLPFITKTEERTKGLGKYGELVLDISSELTSRIQVYVKKHRITINTLMQGVWSYLLHCYTGDDNIMYGIVVSGRPEDLPEVEHKVGLYINSLPLTTSIDKNSSIHKWLIELQNEQVTLRKFQYTSLTKIKEWKGIPGDIFDSVLVFENYPVGKMLVDKEWGLQVENISINEHNNFPLSIVISAEEQIKLQFSYNGGLLERRYVEEISGHFENILFQIAENRTEKISDLTILTHKERETLLTAFNNAEKVFTNTDSIIDHFEDQVNKTPGKVAVIFDAEEISYIELNKRANQIAHYLRKKGVTNETLVPICIERGIQMIAGILGILKAGGAYVPVDPAYPEDRINYMIEDTAGNLILSSPKSSRKLSLSDQVEIIELNKDFSVIADESVEDLHVGISPADLAYIIYTSGSTGRPKGVMVTHKNVVSLVTDNDYASINSEDILLSTGSSSFDATTFEYWSMLLNGGRLVLCEESKLLNSDLLRSEIESREVTKMWFTSSWFNQLVETDITIFKSLEAILVGGEKLSERHVQKFKEVYPSIKVINGYGPTENTTFSLTYNIENLAAGETIPIGKPLNNRTAYILDKDLQLVPVGVSGEIYLGGAGLSRGYLNQQLLTAEKFILNPLQVKTSPNTQEESRLYKTGDLGRWLPDGNIEYLGRMDDQVKIRGYRIELSEIETTLMQSGLVKQAVVVAKETPHLDKQLVGYVVPDSSYSKDSILSYLGSTLPEYMIPSVIIELDQMPLTSNGKIDKKALPDPKIEKSSSEIILPNSDTEKKLSDIWLEILELDEVGINDDFFELGGHSLLAIRLMSMIRKEMEFEISIGDIFEYPTLGALASYLQSHTSGDIQPKIKIGQRPEKIPLSFSQERLWFIDKLEGSVQYHISQVFRLQGDLDKNALEKTFQQIVDRHEA
ncbi:MAG: amino acid adenylation domain-containing protein, partial [Casimicrobiaceae bacterium]